jgi:hypothetical protein
MEREDPADHILIYTCSESEVDLIGYLGAPPRRIAFLHFDHGTD